MFQFTPVLRRATLFAAGNLLADSFNSRPSCDGRREYDGTEEAKGVFQFTPVLRRATPVLAHVLVVVDVSIHARLATGDRCSHRRRRAEQRFNSRPSCDGRHELDEIHYQHIDVSIHARLATGDAN